MRSPALAIGLIVLAAVEGYSQRPVSEEPTSSVLARARALSDAAEANARAKVIQALSDESWYVRGEAARALGRLGDKSLVELTRPLLKDENWFVRSSALEAIGMLGGSGADLTQLAEGPVDVYSRAGVFAAAGAGRDLMSIDVLLKALRDDEPAIRRTAAAALGQLKTSAAVDGLVALLKDEEESVRKSAVVALGKIGDRRAAGAVRAAISEIGPGQWEYAAALYRLGDRDNLNPIIEALASEYADVRQGALSALLEFADSRAVPALLELARSRPAGSPRERFSNRLALATRLSSFDSEDARAALVNMLKDEEPAVRAAAAASLAKAGRGKPEFSERALAAIVLALRNESVAPVISAINEALSSFDRARVTDVLLDSRTSDGKLPPNIAGALAAAGITAETQASQLLTGNAPDRIRAAERLARLGDAKAVQPLIDALTNATEVEVRVKAAEALGSLRDRRAVEALVAASSAPHAELRTAAVLALGRVGDHAAAEALFVATRDEQPAVRDAAIRGLATLGISIDKVAPDLSSPSWQVRAAALATLARLGDRTAVPLIVSALSDGDSRVRAEAARTLGQFTDRGATDALIAALGDQSPDVRAEATLALGRSNDSRAIGPLASLTSDRDPRVSLAAAESLARLRDPRATRVLIDSLANPDWRVRSRAARVLSRVAAEGTLDQAAKPLARVLADDDPVVRYYAAEALAGIGAACVPAVIELMRSSRDADRDRAARVLWRIGAPAVEPLIAVLQERGSPAEMRAAAATTLGLIGDVRAIKALALVLKDDRYFVRQEAAVALGRMGAPALELLLEMAASSTPATREAAIEALGSAGTSRALDRVIEALGDQNQNVRQAAVRALGGSSSERAVPHLIAVLRDESSTLRAQARASLARLGQVAVQALIGALKDPKPSVRQLAAEALGEIGSRDAVVPLIELITTDQSGARAEAVEALGKIGDTSAIPPILSVLRAGSVAVRKKAVAALAKLRDARAFDALIAALTDQNEEVRQAAASGLGELGDDRSIAHLERLADKDASSDVRAAAAHALERIQQQKSRAKPDAEKMSRP
jgi:HEAT repeat protein